MDEIFYSNSLNHRAQRTFLSKTSSVFPNGGSELERHMLTLLANVVGDRSSRYPLTRHDFLINKNHTDVKARSKMDALCRTWLTNVPNGCAVKDPSGDTFNLVNIMYVKEFLLQLVLGTDYHEVLRKGGKPKYFFAWSDIVILVSTAVQKHHYREVLARTSLELKSDILPQVEVETGNGFRCQQVKIVPFDFVYDRRSTDLGYLAEDDTALLAFSRAREFLIVFADHEMSENFRAYKSRMVPQDAYEDHFDDADEFSVSDPCPKAIRLIDHLVQNNLMTRNFAVDREYVAQVTRTEVIAQMAGIDAFDEHGGLLSDKRVYHFETRKRLFGDEKEGNDTTNNVDIADRLESVGLGEDKV